MKKLTFILGLLFIATAAMADEVQRPSLRAETVVSGDVVRIGDLIDNAGIVADVAIFRAPDLGSTGRVRVSDVLEAVRSHALIGLESGGLTEIVVSRPGRTISAQNIEQTIAAAIAAQYGIADAKSLALSFDRGLSAMQIEPGASTLRVSRVVYDPRSGRFDATLDLPGTAQRKRLTGTAVHTVEVVTLSRALSRGDIVKLSDVTVERRPRAESAADLVADPERAVGQAVRSSIAAGRGLRAGDLMKPELVQRNETVTLVYEVPGIALTGRGKALENGAEGDTVEVLNVQSKRSVHGVVTGPGQVTVTLRAPRVIARADSAQ
ncbi:MAG: flagellar basal body P-ring formation protein FlgA [Pseudolabrys sp.]|nr:flagellar basal body P-ring formation protein FlgA [Pseudolabrys sp.]MBV9953995.1 flagellar basal body P-ring formation protein FlgA [Pseudolabrys sp.]